MLRQPGPFLPRVSVFLLMALMTPLLAFVQATGPQRVPVPVIKPKNSAAKSKVDRTTLPPIPIFQDRAREFGVTRSHIAAPEAHYVLDSMSGGAGLFDCDDDGRLDIVLAGGSTVEHLR